MPISGVHSYMDQSPRTDLIRPHCECLGEKAATGVKSKQRQPQGARENRPEHLHIEPAWREWTCVFASWVNGGMETDLGTQPRLQTMEGSCQLIMRGSFL